MKKKVILTIKDYTLVPMNLPPLKKDDIHLAVAAQLPSLYPGNMNITVFDHTKRGDQTLVFVVDRESLNQRKQEKGPPVEFNCTAQFIPDCPDAQNKLCRVFRWSDPDGFDLFFHRGNRIEQAVRIERGRDISSLINSFFSEETPVIIELEETGVRPLFKKQKKSFPPVMFFCFPLFSALIILSLSYIKNYSLTEELNKQKSTLLLVQPSLIITDYPWEETCALLSSHIPPDYYALLNILYTSFKGRAHILSLSIQGMELYLEASGKDGLLIMDDLKNRAVFSHLTLHKIRQNGSTEDFSLSGTFKNDLKGRVP